MWAAFEIQPNRLVNLGIGMPEGVGAVVNVEKINELLTMPNEPGGKEVVTGEAA